MTKYENPQTANLSKVLQDCQVIQQLLLILGKSTRQDERAGGGDGGRQDEEGVEEEGTEGLGEEVDRVGTGNFFDVGL